MSIDNTTLPPMDDKTLARLPNDVDATRFWWIRHAPVPEVRDIMYGSNDVDCDCTDDAVFNGVAARLPKDALWFYSPLKRTKQTADALIAAGAQAKSLVEDPRLIEMNFGDYNGRKLDELITERKDSFVGFFPASPFETTPNGESLSDVAARIDNFTNDMHQQYAGKDIVVVAHRGTILAALHNALKLPLESSVSFRVDNVSLSRLWKYSNIPADGPQYKLGEVGWLP